MQVRDRVEKAWVVMGQVWGIGKRKFAGDYKRRLWLFDRLGSMIGYGAEV